MVEFNDVQFVRTRKQMAGQRAAARSDFDNSRRVISASGFGQFFKNRRLYKEVLPETLRQTEV